MIYSAVAPFKALSNPAVITVLSDTVTPITAFQHLSQFEPTAFLLESTQGDDRLARYSFLGIDPMKTVSFKQGICTLHNCLNNQVQTLSYENPLHILEELLGPQTGLLEQCQLDLPFQGGLVGYLGYGATAQLHQIPAQENNPLSVPDGFYGLYDSVIAFDHQARRIKIISHRGQDHARLLLSMLNATHLHQPAIEADLELDSQECFAGVINAVPKEKFLQLVEQCQNHIAQGEIFQIVLSQRFSLPISCSAADIYRMLQAVNPSPYSYFLKCPDFEYVGSSPETFVQCREKEVTLRALAGTRPRSNDSYEDYLLGKELQSNEKELAEHHMLVDLGRNDLGRVCQPGTIAVGEIATLTRYAHVMHLATEITGRLDDDKDIFDLTAGCFPRGTVSGAPKIRAMQLLSQLESEQRGIYSGVVGYFDFQRNTDGAIAIRSALIKDGMAHVNAGAGIVFDSDPLAEYEETRNKARSVMKAIKLAERFSSCQ
jgi:anthranilate synthase component I